MNKINKFLRVILALVILTSCTPNIIYAKELQTIESRTVADENLSLQEDNISYKLQKNIKDAIIEIYGKDDSEEIFNRVMQIADKAIENRPADLK